MPRNTLNPLETIRQADEYSSAILGTYQLDGEFFENDVLPSIQTLGVNHTVVLTDTNEYRTTDTLTHAGTQYYLDHVRCPGAFHPKFVLLLGHRRGLCLLGSGNLTAAGWQRNAELATTLTYTADEAATSEDSDATPTADDPVNAAFTQLVEFIHGIMTTDRVPSEKTRTAVTEALRDAPWLSHTTASSASDSLQLLHNLQRPLLDQVFDQIPQEDIHDIEVISPFFSGTDTQVLTDLCRATPDQLTLNIQPDRVQGFDADALTTTVPADTDVTVNAVTAGDDTNRYLHAKLFVFRGTDDVWTLYGSPNLTTPALANSAAAGNIELAVLRHEPIPGYFEYLLDTSLLQRSPITPGSVTHRTYDPTDTDTEATLSLTGATLQTDGDLVLTIDTLSDEIVTITVHLCHPRNDETLDLDVTVKHVEDGTIHVSDERIVAFHDSATQVWITVHTDDETLRTDRRWIASHTLMAQPRTSEIKQIKDSHGRSGLVNLLNRMEGLDVIYHFLDDLDIGSDDINPSIPGGTGTNGGDDDPGGSGMDDRNLPEFSDLLEEKVDAFHNRLETKVAEPKGDDTWANKFDQILNLFIGGAKLTLWWTERDPDASLHLRYIRLGMDKLSQFLTRTRGVTEIQDVERDRHLLEHVAIIAYHVNDLLVRTNRTDGADATVYKVFQRTIRSTLQTCAVSRSDPIPDTESLADCLEEYDGIKDRPPSPKRVQAFCKQFLSEK
ncbi:hypothetical protein [Natrinema sp. 1APR25-10V2]|uniref:hypothetical protein n=1 Tax=Natrinema sp. 1APR25-10V2 TaxID=2951081 RepID=UPI002875A82A|nr:hypothetical protein [Natrinema sp. 1APR25-10V2]MDS0474359.1 hypothetical protein [Natrinema sp. 1APR25-10V2]